MNGKIIDLTYALTFDIPHWDEDACFGISTLVDYQDCQPPNFFRTQKIEMKVGMGTHIDAPAHCIPGGKTVDLLQPDTLVVDCVVIKVNEGIDENYVAGPEIIEQFEQKHGKIQPNTFVLFDTGWNKYWSDPKKYRNNLSFPSVHEATAKLLIERDIAGLGIDTLSSDAGGKDFPVHRAILGAGKYLVENIANAEKLPPVGTKVVIMPMKMKGATEAPVRIVALF